MSASAVQSPITVAGSQSSFQQHDVKRKFFNTIGIDSSLPTKMPGSDSTTASDWVHPRSQSVSTFQEKLKYDPHTDRFLAPQPQNNETPTKRRSKKKSKALSFDETVEVVPIPMRTEYSNRVRSRLWSSAMELHENAARNSIEFASEGWNWRNCLEDERMYVCVATSELVHPIHYHQSFPHGFR